MDFWLAYEGYGQAYQRDHALENLERLTLDIVGRGPEGEQIHYDKDGNKVKSEGRVEFTQLHRLIESLQIAAGILEPKPGEKPLTKQQKKSRNVFQQLARLARGMNVGKGVTGGSAKVGDKP